MSAVIDHMEAVRQQIMSSKFVSVFEKTTMSSVCHLHVICMSSVCHLYVTCMSPVCHLHVVCMSPVCHLYVTCMSPVCHLYVVCMSPVCHLYVICMSSVVDHASSKRGCLSLSSRAAFRVVSTAARPQLIEPCGQRIALRKMRCCRWEMR